MNSGPSCDKASKHIAREGVLRVFWNNPPHLLKWLCQRCLYASAYNLGLQLWTQNCLKEECVLWENMSCVLLEDIFYGRTCLLGGHDFLDDMSYGSMSYVRSCFVGDMSYGRTCLAGIHVFR